MSCLSKKGQIIGLARPPKIKKTLTFQYFRYIPICYVYFPYMAGRNEDIAGSPQKLILNQQREDSSTRLRDVLRGNRQSGKGGIYAVCSAHPAVIEAAVQQSLEDGSILLVESTSSQVNQFGGSLPEERR